MAKTRVMGWMFALTLVIAATASAQTADIATVLRENQKLREENSRLKSENDQTKRRIEELRKRASGEGVKAVAVVDIVKAFDALIEKTEFDADFKGKGGEAVEEDRKKRERIDILKKRLDEEVIGTKGYDEKQKELDDATLEYQLWLAGEQGKLLATRNQRMEEIYKKMMDAIAVLAKQNKYDQVMLKEPDLNLTSTRPEDVAALIRSRKVLWSTNDLELTDQLVKYMNDAYVKGKSSASK